MDRFHLPAVSWDSLSLGGDEAHHCIRVMRKRPGDEIEIFDGEGRMARAIIEEAGKRNVSLRLAGVEIRQALSPVREVAVGIPKGKTMELIVQKAVELGASRIIPLVTEQGNVRLGGEEARRKQGKWQRLALEACKQCGQNFIPEVTVPGGLREWLAEDQWNDGDRLSLVAALEGERRGLREALALSREKDARMAIGPEGDFSPKEYHFLAERGFEPVSLGPLILRTETAVLKMLSFAGE